MITYACLGAFGSDDNDVGLVDPVEHVIDASDHPPVGARARRYSRANRVTVAEKMRENKSPNAVRPFELTLG